MVYLSLRYGNNAMIMEYVWDIHGIFISHRWNSQFLGQLVVE